MSGRDHRFKPGFRSPGGPEPYRKPPLSVFPTTLWEYPSQHYGDRQQGSKHYAGATPSWVIWQLLQRYTRKADLVVDPMCGSGTTVDVAADLSRRCACFDLGPTREEIAQADARSLPLGDGAADFVFIDPPYSTHIDYTDDPRCIGRLDAADPAGASGGNGYYTAMDAVFAESHRVLRDKRFMAVYVSDSFRKGIKPPRRSFMPIGFELFWLLSRRFVPVDIVSVVRHNEKLARGNWRRSAVEGNYFLRGFNYLLIVKKDARLFAELSPSVSSVGFPAPRPSSPRPFSPGGADRVRPSKGGSSKGGPSKKPPSKPPSKQGSFKQGPSGKKKPFREPEPPPEGDPGSSVSQGSPPCLAPKEIPVGVPGRVPARSTRFPAKKFPRKKFPAKKCSPRQSGPAKPARKKAPPTSRPTRGPSSKPSGWRKKPPPLS